MTKEVYDNAVNVLLDAYNNGTLFHGDCNACAVGNLCASAIGTKVDSDKEWAPGKMAYWNYWFMNGRIIARGDWPTGYEAFMGMRQIMATNMSIEELCKIESAFENCKWDRNNTKKGQYDGLVAVLNVMKDMAEEEVPHTQNVYRLETIYETFKQP